MSKSLIIYFSRADENYSVGYIDKCGLSKDDVSVLFKRV